MSPSVDSIIYIKIRIKKTIEFSRYFLLFVNLCLFELTYDMIEKNDSYVKFPPSDSPLTE